MSPRPRIVFALGVAFASACTAPGPESPGADAGGADAGADSGLPLPGFGAITGDCDVLDAELTSTNPTYVASSIDFASMYTDADRDRLTAGGREIIADGNAGGSSLLSEVFAYEVLARCELAGLVKTETEIVYDGDGAITDLLVAIDDVAIGVSVTRAVAFPFEDPYTPNQARALLEDKLAGVLESSAQVSAADRWQKQILAVLAYGPEHGASLAAAYADIDPALAADTIVWAIVTDGADDFIYGAASR